MHLADPLVLIMCRLLFRMATCTSFGSLRSSNVNPAVMEDHVEVEEHRRTGIIQAAQRLWSGVEVVL